MAGLVTCETVDGVADLRLDRPEKLNALNDELFAELRSSVEDLSRVRGLRAVVLSGNGRAFCAGLDLALFKRFAAESEAGERPFAAPSDPAASGDPAGTPGRAAGRGQAVVRALRELPVPVIAAVHGPAIGGGLQIALGADLRLVTSDATLALREITFGITPDMGGTQLLPPLIGYGRALELIVTGRSVSGDEAVRIGLASRTCQDPRAEALELAREVATKSPTAVRLAKGLARMSGSVPLEEGLRAELEVLSTNMGSPNQVEAVHAYFERRPAHFTDPDLPTDRA